MSPSVQPTDALISGSKRAGVLTAGAALVALVALGALYVSLGLGNPYVGLLADDGLYLLMADMLAPGGAPDLPVYAHVRAHSQLPPLFPLALGLAGGGSQDLAAARIFVALAMLTAVAVNYCWLRQLSVNRLAVAVLGALFALMPITVIHTVDLWSEGMYIALSLGALITFEHARREHFALLPCLAAGVIVGAAIATRTAGVALLPAMLIVCLRAGRPRAWWMWPGTTVFLAIVSMIDMGQAGVSYGDLLLGRYREAPLDTLFAQLTTSAIAARDAFPYVLFQWRALNPLQWLLSGLVALLMLTGVLEDLRRLRPPAVYAAAYCAIVAVWPFPELYDRFLFPLVPLMLYFAYRGARQSAGSVLPGKPEAPTTIVVALLVSLSVPGIVRTFAAASSAPAGEAAATFSTTRYWLDTTRVGREQQAFDYLRVLHDTLPELRAHVPADACIQTTLTNLVLVRARRIAVLPVSRSRLSAGDFGHCRFFYVSAKPIRGEVPMYPYAIVKPWVDVVAIYRRPGRGGEDGDAPIAGMLLRGK